MNCYVSECNGYEGYKLSKSEFPYLKCLVLIKLRKGNNCVIQQQIMLFAGDTSNHRSTRMPF
ncbi:hypothetical protein MHBO_002616 [Bonamia ostreae]|uniref:Uncharacterized protein n=1 Tax=Bonamia ostreae TaxID=126728 RepID=A0ABV2AMY5_9EUKA